MQMLQEREKETAAQKREEKKQTASKETASKETAEEKSPKSKKPPLKRPAAAMSLSKDEGKSTPKKKHAVVASPETPKKSNAAQTPKTSEKNAVATSSQKPTEIKFKIEFGPLTPDSVKFAKPSFSVEATRSQVLCRSGYRGVGQSVRLTYGEHGVFKTQNAARACAIKWLKSVS
jgi:hypothetical protein